MVVKIGCSLSPFVFKCLKQLILHNWVEFIFRRIYYYGAIIKAIYIYIDEKYIIGVRFYIHVT